MSVISGTIGAFTAADAQRSAANKSAQAAQYAADIQKQMYEQSRKDLAPYQQAGYAGLGRLTGQDTTYTDPLTGQTITVAGTGTPFDLMKGVGEQPSYEKTVTEQLGNYAASPQYQAQNAIAQQALQRQLNARGLNYGATGASAGAELSQKLTASDYDKYKADLAAKYAAMQGEYSQRRDINAQQYQQLLDLTKMGQGSAASAGQAGQTYAGQAGQTANTLANIYGQQGTATAGLWSGLGKASAGTVGAGLQLAKTGKDLGWWGGTPAPETLAAPTAYQGTMVEAAAPAYGALPWETGAAATPILLP